MSLDKATKSGKEHSKPYRKSKRFDETCRNHGGCSYCEGNRKHSTEVRERYVGALKNIFGFK